MSTGPLLLRPGVDRTTVILFTVTETAATVLAMAWFVYRPESAIREETPSWLLGEEEFSETAALDRLSLLYGTRQDAA
jgi:hypothetical protein